MNDGEDRLCSKVEGIFALLARKWAGLLVFELRAGEKRFADLRSAIPGLSSRVLTLRLRELEASGLVERLVSPSSPVRVAYRLTARGRSLAPVMESLALWAQEEGIADGQSG